jgi:selenocysteine lyase/cysteine desulfurase
MAFCVYFTNLELMNPDFDVWRKDNFPFFKNRIFLTHASVSPLPTRSRDALCDYVTRIAGEGQFDPAHEHIYKRCKERFAELIGAPAKPTEIAFAGSTSHALGLVATSLNWQPGDNCVVADGDFPANVIIWKNLQHTHNVEVRMIPFRPAMDLTLDDIAPLIDERTKIVSLASANFLSGFPIDINAIGAWLGERGVLFCVDAIQTLGAIEFDATNVDFVCADAHKWLLGPNGTAVLWARKEVLQTMRPQILGWLAVQGRDNWLAYDTTPIDSAERFEPGARNYLGIVATEASLSLLQEFGMGKVEKRVVELRDYATQKLEALDCRFLWQPTPGSRGGVVTFQPPHGEIAVLYNHLEERFALSLRQDRFGRDWLRISAHFTNCEADLDKLADAIQAQL